MKVAIVHYWLVSMRGGEKVVETLCELFPEADVFTHVYDPSGISDTIRRHQVHTTFIQKLPNAVRRYRSYLPLMPIALEQLNLQDYDLVISSESGPAKGVVTSPDTLHVCYCHTPMRYLWDMYHNYLSEADKITRLFMRPIIHYLRIWDLANTARVDLFVANSHYVARRIRKTYRRSAQVIHPPVEIERFEPKTQRQDFYLTISEFVPYKKIDLIVAAFTKLGLPLVVIGDGSDWEKVKRSAGSNIQLLGRQPDQVVKDYMECCKAFVFAADEDFGIAPVEAQAAGAPVIAYGRGGVCETVIPRETGLFFQEQTIESLMEAVHKFESGFYHFDSKCIRKHAEQFSKERFQREFLDFIEQEWMSLNHKYVSPT